MALHLEKSIIGLNGASGSGKGVAARAITETYQAKGYEVIYVSSGDLFRAAAHDPEIQARVHSGVFSNTIGAILPGLKKKYQEFLTAWTNTEGRAVLILDGFIRGEGAINQTEKVIIPSQIDQIAILFDETNREMAATNSQFSALYPEIGSAPNILETQAEVRRRLVEEAHQILIDVSPLNIRAQIQRRTNAEIADISSQVSQLFSTTSLDSKSAFKIWQVLEQLSAMANGRVARVEGKLVVLFETNPEKISAEDNKALAADLAGIRDELAAYLGAPDQLHSLADIFRGYGISTELREDDIVGVDKRIANYVGVKTNLEGQSLYTPGMASRALMEAFGFKFNPQDGSFTSSRENCLVLPNGAERKVPIEQFQEVCKQAAIRFQAENRSTPEGQSLNLLETRAYRGPEY